jgi:hypothetical protein
MIGCRVGDADQISDLVDRDDRVFKQVFEHPMIFAGGTPKPVRDDRAVTLAQRQDLARRLGCFGADISDPG